MWIRGGGIDKTDKVGRIAWERDRRKVMEHERGNDITQRSARERVVVDSSGGKREIVNGKKKVVEKNLQPVCRLEIKIYFPSCLQNVSQGYFI